MWHPNIIIILLSVGSSSPWLMLTDEGNFPSANWWSSQGRVGTSLQNNPLGGNNPLCGRTSLCILADAELFFYVLLRKYSNVWRSQAGRQRGTRALLKYFGHKQKVLKCFFSALCPLGAQGPAANCIIALLITYDSLPVRTGPDVLFFDNAGSFRAIMLVQFPA